MSVGLYGYGHFFVFKPLMGMGFFFPYHYKLVTLIKNNNPKYPYFLCSYVEISELKKIIINEIKKFAHQNW